MDELQICTLADRPDLLERWYDIESGWPTFIGHDPIGDALWNLSLRTFPAYAVVALRGDEIVARGRAVPFAYPSADRVECVSSGVTSGAAAVVPGVVVEVVGVGVLMPGPSPGRRRSGRRLPGMPRPARRRPR